MGLRKLIILSKLWNIAVTITMDRICKISMFTKVMNKVKEVEVTVTGDEREMVVVRTCKQKGGGDKKWAHTFWAISSRPVMT